MHPQRRRRLIWLLVLVLGVGLVVALSSYALRQNINLFFTPSQLAANEADDGQRIQVDDPVVRIGQFARQREARSIHLGHQPDRLNQRLDPHG